MSIFNKVLAAITLCIFFLPIKAQQTVVKGRITDIETGEFLPFATISYKSKGNTYGVISDKNGYYRLETKEIVDTIVVQYVSYKTFRQPIKRFMTQTINIKMASESITMSEIEIKAKRKTKEKYRRKGNPAVQLVRKVQQNKEKNNITVHDYFQYDEYNKIEIGLSNLGDDIAEKYKDKKFSFILDNMQSSELTGKNFVSLYFVETMNEIYYRKEPKTRKNILTASKDVEISKFLDYSTLEPVLNNLIGDVDVYQPTIFLFNNEYTSPLSSVATLFYHFYIADTVDFQNKKCAVLSFTPANQQDLGLCGSLWITLDSTYSIRKAKVQLPKNSGTNYVEAMLFEQEYEQKDSILLPTDFTLIADLSYLGLSFHAKRTGTIDNIVFEKTRDDEFYDSFTDNSRASDFMKPNETFWEASRPDSLTEHEQQIYADNKRLLEIPLYRFLTNTILTLSCDYIDAGRFDIGPFYNTVSYNDIEGWRFRLGGKTTTAFNKHLYFSGFLAYGTKDDKLKYNAKAMYSFNEKLYNQWEFPMNLLTVSYEHNTYLPGREAFGSIYYQDFDRVFNSFSRLNLDKMVFVDKVNLTYDYEFTSQIGLKFYTEYLEQRPLGNMKFVTLAGEECTPLTTLTLGGEVRYARGEKVYQIQQNRKVVASSVAPVFTLGYSYVKALSEPNYEYHKLLALIEKRWFFSILGVADVKLGGGKIFGDAPYPLLFIPRGNQSLFMEQNSFNLMNYNEFVCDYYAQLSVQYNFNGFIFNRIPLLSKLKLREILGFKAIIGGLTDDNDPNIATNTSLFPLPVNDEGVVSTTTFGDDPYMEASIGIGNIFKILRVDYIRRFSYLDNPNVDEWGIQLTLKIAF